MVTLQPGTNLAIRLGDPLSSDHNYAGQMFRATLDAPLIVNGFIIADQGSPVFGRVVYARKARVIGGASELDLTLNQISTTDGQLVSIQTNQWEQQGARGNLQNTAKMAVGAALGAVVGAVAGAAKGAGISSALDSGSAEDKLALGNHRTVVLPTGTQLRFTVASAITIVERLNGR